MSRRRALMAAQNSGNGLLFERRNLVVATGDQIVTGVKPFIAGRSITILVDFLNTVNPTTTDDPASKWKLIRMYSSALSKHTLTIGKTDETTAFFKFWWYEALTAGTVMGNTYTAANHRNRIAFTHEAGSNDAVCRATYGTLNPVTYTRTKTFAADDTELTFGGPANSVNSLPAGTFNLIQVWDRILSADEINAFFA